MDGLRNPGSSGLGIVPRLRQRRGISPGITDMTEVDLAPKTWIGEIVDRQQVSAAVIARREATADALPGFYILPLRSWMNPAKELLDDLRQFVQLAFPVFTTERIHVR